jgi:hypothetical protein
VDDELRVEGDERGRGIEFTATQRYASKIACSRFTDVGVSA